MTVAGSLSSANPSAPAWDWNNNADLHFWAPGMGNNTIHLSQVQGGGSEPQYIGNYYVYVIKGISGSLTLGNRNIQDQYWTPFESYQREWTQQSWATFGFAINHRPYTETGLFLEVSGDHAGATTGPVTQLLHNPVIIRSRGSWDTSITFIPHANPYFLSSGAGLANKTPSGRIVILADVYSRPPEPTGNLDLSDAFVFPSASVTVSYSYDQGEDALLEGSFSAGAGSPLFLSSGSTPSLERLGKMAVRLLQKQNC